MADETCADVDLSLSPVLDELWDCLEYSIPTNELFCQAKPTQLSCPSDIGKVKHQSLSRVRKI